jgi:hypothetical protein
MTDHLQSFEVSQVGDVLADVSGGAEDNLRRELTDVLEKEIRQFLFGLVNMPKLATLGAPHVMLRVRTFQTILDDFRGALGEQYDPILTRIGRAIGFNFGITLLRVLKHANRLPLEYDALLEFWAKFDSAAQMGEYRLQLKEYGEGGAVVDVIIRDLFLTLGYEDDDPLRHCPFITGYFDGALDTALFLWTRWIRQSIFKDPRILWSVSGYDAPSREEHGVVHFNLRLIPERWPELKDLLYRAVELGEAKKWNESILSGRMALERGLVRFAEEDPPDLKVSFGKLLDQLARVRAPLDVDRWKRTYAECSETAHTVKVISEMTVSNILFNVWRCLKEVESVVVAPEFLTEIKQNRARYVIR